MAASKPRRTSKPRKKGASNQPEQPERSPALRREIYGVLVASISVMLLFALLSHQPQNADSNWIGPVGRLVAESTFGFFGLGAFLIVATAIAISIWLLFGKHRRLRAEGIIGSLLVVFSSSALSSVIFPDAKAWGAALGGWLGRTVAELVAGVLGTPGAVVVLIASTLVGVILITRSSFVDATTRAVQRLRNSSESTGFLGRIGALFGALRDNLVAFFANMADRRRLAKERKALDAALDDNDDESYDDDDDAYDDEPEAFPSVRIADDARNDAFDPPPVQRHVASAAIVAAAEPTLPSAFPAAPPEPVSAAPALAAEPARAQAGPKAQQHAFDPPQERSQDRSPSDDEDLHPGTIRARELLARHAANRQAGTAAPVAPAAPAVSIPAVEHETRGEDVVALAADAARFRAQLHHPIDNPMVNTTRANTPVAPSAPVVASARSAFDPVSPAFAPVSPAPAAGAVPPSAPVSSMRSAAFDPQPPAGVRSAAFDPQPPAGMAAAPAPSVRYPAVTPQAPAAVHVASPVAPVVPPAAKMQPIVSQRMDLDIGVEDLPPPYSPSTAELEAPPPIMRPVRHDEAAFAADAGRDDVLIDDAEFDAEFDADFDDDEADEVGATAPHRVAWSDLQNLQKAAGDDRATRPLDPLEDADFDADDALTGPQIIESEAAKSRPSNDAMSRALRSMAAERAASDWNFPSLDMLRYEESTSEIDEVGLRELASQLVEALADYKVRGRVTGICPGPVVTRFEFEPDAGTKISRISGLSTDIAMRLRAENVRIIAPIPGKGCVGVEIPNDIRETVYLKEILADRRFTEARSKLTMALGKDIEGFPVVADLAKMPHLLVAGTTGSGKSVSVNAMITSVLFNATPDEVRLILIDPKQLEFALYEDVPHLLLPVVTDPMKAATALQWAVDDMERRYRLMKELRVRNIEGYNQKIKQLQDELRDEEAGRGKASAFAVRALSEEDMDGRPRHRHMPYIIVVVDEFADLMMAAGKDVEIAVARIAQKARAAGIHCILATQRPSVDVLTGTIKSNFPTRISFRLISGTDSRTVVDTNGAENLLGMGDMLFRPPGSSDLVRVHGAFVDEDEIERVVEFLKNQREVEYDETILSAQVSGTEDDAEAGFDAKYDEALECCVEAGFASISMIQRRCGIGYNRAANIIEEMERRGVVGPSSGGAKRREVYIR